jgi:hypothetical protein
MLMFAGSGGGVPLGIPPLPDDPMLSKVAPEECLLYFSSAGIANPDPKSTNQTERLCAEPEVQKAIADLEKLIRASIAESTKKGSPKDKALAESVPTLVKALLTRPLAVYVSEVKFDPKAKGSPQFRGGAILSLGDDGDDVKGAFEKLLSLAGEKEALKDVTIAGTTFHQLSTSHDGPQFILGAKGKYYYIATGEGEMEALLKRADGSAPKWLTALHKQLPVDRVSTVMMLNAHSVVELMAPLIGPDAAKVMDAIGVKDLDRVVGVSGLDKEGMISRSLVSFKGEPKGIFQLFEQKPLTTADLDLIPNNATFALALKFDAGKAWTTLLDIMEKADPKSKEKLLEHMGEQGKEIVADISKALGDSWCVFDSPTEGGLFTGATAVISIKDADAATALQKKLLAALEGDRAPMKVENFTFNDKTVHVMVSREKGFPLAPSWCLTDKHLIVAAYPGAIKGFLSRGKNFQGLTKVPEVAKALEGEGQTMSVSYLNMQRVFDLLYPLAPIGFAALASELGKEHIDLPPDMLPSAGSIRRHLRPSVSVLRRTPDGIEAVSHQIVPGGQGLTSLPILVGLLVPAVQKTRAAAERVGSSNNLHQMSLGMLNMADSNKGVMPAAAIYSKEGKPLLSWRVAILPYVEQDNLYKEFHLDEPWDSEHNKKLLAKMPKIYLRPGAAPGETMTHYRVFHGPGAAFEGKEGVNFPAGFTDGSSQTILVVEAEEGVPWTKPDELPFDEKKDLPPLGLKGNDYFVVAMADGSVHVVRKSISKETLKAAITRNAGDLLGPDW